MRSYISTKGDMAVRQRHVFWASFSILIGGVFSLQRKSPTSSWPPWGDHAAGHLLSAQDGKAQGQGAASAVMYGGRAPFFRAPQPVCRWATDRVRIGQAASESGRSCGTPSDSCISTFHLFERLARRCGLCNPPLFVIGGCGAFQSHTTAW